MIRLQMTVRHGRYNHNELVEAETITEALLKLKTLPIGSYAPSCDAPRFPIVIQALLDTGKHSLGWADYEVIP